jgi:hypothetical protein
MYDEDARPFTPGQGFSRMMNALVGGGTNMPRVGFLDGVEQLPVVRTLRLESQLPDIVTNPSVAVFQDRLLVSIRHITGDPALGVLTPTVNFLGEIGDDFTLTNVQRLNDSEASQSLGYKPLYGFEDLRLFVHEGKLLALAATAKGQSVGFARATMCLLDVEGGGLKNPRLLQSPRYERNWIPVCDQGLRLIYSVAPLIVMGPEANVPAAAPPGAVLRGSSQAVRWGDGYLAVVHEVAGDHKHARKIEYTHRFVLFSQDLTAVKIGRPFCFQKRGIEFCAGLAIWNDRDQARIMISYGVDDRRAYVSEVADDVVASMLSEAAVVHTLSAVPAAPSLNVPSTTPPEKPKPSGGGGRGGNYGDTSGFP